MTTNRYTIPFSGAVIEVTVTDRALSIDEWIHEVRSIHTTSGQNNVNNHNVVGLDCEWLPPSWTGTLSNRTATLQLCIDRKCLIVQLFYLDHIPTSLSGFLRDPNFVFVGVEVGDDVDKLRNEYGISCGTTADIQAMAMDKWPLQFYRKPGLKELARKVVGIHMPKPMHVCKSNWEARVLSLEQVEYACIDAYSSYRIGNKLLNET